MAGGKPKYKSHWDANSPQQVAQSMVRQAVRQGKIVKPEQCETCGAYAQVVGHHWRGYDHPLDVWWVCISCNKRLDRHDGSVTLEQARRQMAKTKKTDNSFMESKLELRRYFLKHYHVDEPLKVLDCCQGTERIWGRLKQEFRVDQYWGVDIKPKPGRLKIDSTRILQQPGWDYNVIDVDTYGSPWAHYVAILKNAPMPCTVFLTIGSSINAGGTNLSNIAKSALGVADLKIPPSILGKLVHVSTSYVLASSCEYGILISEAMEAFPSRNARYIGLRLERAAAGVEPDSREHTHADKEHEHV